MNVIRGAIGDHCHERHLQPPVSAALSHRWFNGQSCHATETDRTESGVVRTRFVRGQNYVRTGKPKKSPKTGPSQSERSNLIKVGNSAHATLTAFVSPKDALDFVNKVASQRTSMPLDIGTYQEACVLCYQLVQHQNLMALGDAREKALGIVHLADKEHGRDSTKIVPLYATVSRVCAEHGDIQGLVRIFNRAGPSGILFCNVLFHGLAKAIRRSGISFSNRDVTELKDLLHSILKQDTPSQCENIFTPGLSFPAAKDLMVALADTKPIDRGALAVLWKEIIPLLQSKYMTTRTLNEILNYMKTFSCNLDQREKLLSPAGAAASVYRTMMRRGVEPDEITFNTMMAMASKEGSLGAALTSLTASKEHNVGVSSRMVTSLMTLLIQQEAFIPLFRLYQLAVSSGAWDAGVNFRFITGPLRKNRIDVALSAMRVVSICSYLNRYGKLPEALEAEHIELKQAELSERVAELQSQKEYAQYLQTMTIGDCAKLSIQGLADSAERELKKIHQQVQEYVPSHIESPKDSKSVSDKYADSMMHLVEELVVQDGALNFEETISYPMDEARSEDVATTSKTFTDGLEDVIDHSLCAPIDFLGSTASCNGILDALCRLDAPKKHVKKFIDWMDSSRIPRDNVTYKNLCRFFVNNENYTEAMKCLTEAAASGLLDDRLVSNTCDALLRKKAYEPCFAILEQGLFPSLNRNVEYTWSLWQKMSQNIHLSHGRNQRLLRKVCDLLTDNLQHISPSDTARLRVCRTISEYYQEVMFQAVLDGDYQLCHELYRQLADISCHLISPASLRHVQNYVYDAAVTALYRLPKNMEGVIQNVDDKTIDGVLEIFADLSPDKDDSHLDQQVYLFQSVDILKFLKCHDYFHNPSVDGWLPAVKRILENSLNLVVVQDFNKRQSKQRYKSLIDFVSASERTAPNAEIQSPPYTASDILSSQFLELFRVGSQWLTVFKNAGETYKGLKPIDILTNATFVVDSEGGNFLGDSECPEGGVKPAAYGELRWTYHVAVRRALRGGRTWEAGRLASRLISLKTVTFKPYDVVDLLGMIVHAHLSGQTSSLDSLDVTNIKSFDAANADPILNLALEVCAYHGAFHLYDRLLDLGENSCGKSPLKPSLGSLRFGTHHTKGFNYCQASLHAVRLNLECDQPTSMSLYADIATVLNTCLRVLSTLDYHIENDRWTLVKNEIEQIDKLVLPPKEAFSPEGLDPERIYSLLGLHKVVDIDNPSEVLWKMGMMLFRLDQCDSSVWDTLLAQTIDLASVEKVTKTYEMLLDHGYHPSNEILKNLRVLFVRHNFHDEAFYVDAQINSRAAASS